MNRICDGLMASMGFILIAILGGGLLWMNNFAPALFIEPNVNLMRLWQYVAWGIIVIGAVGTCAVTLIRYEVTGGRK